MTSLISATGQPHFGFHDQPVGRINYEDFDLRTMMDRPRSRLARRMGFNQFQFIGLMGPQWIGGIAIVDLKWLSVGFFYLYDRETGERLERTLKAPLARGAGIEPDPDHGEAWFRGGGTDIRISPQGQGETRRVTVRDPRRRIEADFHIQAGAAANPLRVCSPAGYQRWSFTQKHAGLPVQGQWRWGDRVYECGHSQYASLDWSCGHMRRETAWSWASLAGQAESGETLGLNLATGINESGVSENGLWVDGQLSLPGQAEFLFDRYSQNSPWQVRTRDARVVLDFEPAGCRSERINAGVIASNFRQYYGVFSGTVQDDSGRKYRLRGVPGFCEDHYAKW